MGRTKKKEEKRKGIIVGWWQGDRWEEIAYMTWREEDKGDGLFFRLQSYWKENCDDDWCTAQGKREQLLASYNLSISFFKNIPTFQLKSYCLNKIQHLSGNLSETFRDKTQQKDVAKRCRREKLNWLIDWKHPDEKLKSKVEKEDESESEKKRVTPLHLWMGYLISLYLLL